METSVKHKLLDEHSYNGLLLCGQITVDALQKVKSLDLNGDVVIASYPKTGATWTKEIVWIVNSDCDLDGARKSPSQDRTTYLEIRHSDQVCHNVDRIKSTPHPRVVHTHLLPEYFENQLCNNTKFVVVIRNPKDTLVSFYHFYQINALLGNFKGSWDEFFELYKAKHILYTDYFDWYMKWIPYLNQPNVMLLKYEDMIASPKTQIKRIAEFLGKSLDEIQLEKLVDHSSFDKMKSNPMTNYAQIAALQNSKHAMVRQGGIGGWKNYFSDEQNEIVDQRYSETLLKMGLELTFE